MTEAMFGKDPDEGVLWEEEEEEPRPALGEGLSRPKPGESTRLFTVEVKPPGAQRMRWTTPAPSADAALTYASNRWPHADVRLSP
jgi:hypothetical protein